MDKLDRTKEKCREIIALGKGIKADDLNTYGWRCDHGAFVYECAKVALPIARSTLTAIEWFSEQNNEEALNAILAAWPDELL